MMMVAMLSAGFIACDDDDDDDDNGGGSSSAVIGAWSYSDEMGSLTLTFRNDGTGTFISVDEDPDTGTETERGTFSYRMEGESKGYVYESVDGSEVVIFYFEIKGRNMYIYEDGYGGYLEWILTKK